MLRFVAGAVLGALLMLASPTSAEFSFEFHSVMRELRAIKSELQSIRRHLERSDDSARIDRIGRNR